jgi:hypothetical protein
VFIYGRAHRILQKLRDLKQAGLQPALNRYIETLYARYCA